MKKYLLAALAVVLLTTSGFSATRDTVYHFDGHPEKWNFELTPYLFMPRINGQLESPYLSESFGVSAVDLLSMLKMAFMIDGEISKGRFFVTPNYMYFKMGTESVIRTSHSGEKTAVAKPELQAHIAELMAGMHFTLNPKWSLDPYAGFRYNGFNTTINIEGIRDTTSVEEKGTYWDPVLGFRTQYLATQRLSFMLKADIGGFGVGSRIATSAGLTSSYAISPQVDLLGGFSVYAADFVNESKTSNEVSLAAAFYGFHLGARILFPKRFRDPAIFKKDKSK